MRQSVYLYAFCTFHLKHKLWNLGLFDNVEMSTSELKKVCSVGLGFSVSMENREGRVIMGFCLASWSECSTVKSNNHPSEFGIFLGNLYLHNVSFRATCLVLAE